MNETLEKYRNRESAEQNAERLARAEKAIGVARSAIDSRIKSTVTMRNLATLAKEHGVTQSAIAKHTGIAQTSVSATLNGKNSPQLDRVYRLLDAVNVLAGQSYTLHDVETYLRPPIAQ